MGEIRTIRCAWCKRLLWSESDGGAALDAFGYEQYVKDEPCRCIGYGRHRFMLRVKLRRLLVRLRRALGA